MLEHYILKNWRIINSKCIICPAKDSYKPSSITETTIPSFMDNSCFQIVLFLETSVKEIWPTLCVCRTLKLFRGLFDRSIYRINWTKGKINKRTRRGGLSISLVGPWSLHPSVIDRVGSVSYRNRRIYFRQRIRAGCCARPVCERVT